MDDKSVERQILRSRLAIVVVALAALTAVALGYRFYEQARELPAGLILANGRIEGDSVIVASKQPGRIAALLAHEGDIVAPDQVLLKLNDRTARARAAQATAALTAALARTNQCQAELHLLTGEVPHRTAAAEAGVAAGRATLSQAQATKQQAGRDVLRYRTLVNKGSLDQETLERAELGRRRAHDGVAIAEATLAQARQTLNDARLGPQRIDAKMAEVNTFTALAAQAREQLAEAESVLDDLTVVAPAAGTITTRHADLGEVVNVGAPLFELVDLGRLYLEVFIPEVHIGKLRLGLPARIYTDAFPDQPIPATVRYIASRAEFTPKEIQTPNERVKLVYAVKLYLEPTEQGPIHHLAPGLPADAIIRWQADAPWTKPRW